MADFTFNNSWIVKLAVFKTIIIACIIVFVIICFIMFMKRYGFGVNYD